MSSLPWKSASQASAPVPQTTSEKIVQRAIALFNERGFQHVTINDIAEDLKISPGNLTYHFKHKRDLVKASLDVMHERLHKALVKTNTINNADEAAAYLLDLFRAFWDFRFFFNALTFLLTKDDELRDEYFAFRDWALETMESNLVKLNARGFYRSVTAPNTYRLIARNMWSQQLDWLAMQQIKSPTTQTPDLYDCVLCHWSLNEPHMERQFAQELIEAYQGQLREN